MMKIEVVCLKKFDSDDYQRDSCRKSGKRLCYHRLCHVHGRWDYAPYRVFYRRVELAVAELLICLGICLIIARIVLVEDEAAHAALFSVAVNIETRRLSEADIDIADLSDIRIFVVVTDIYAEHIALFAERLELAGVDVRYRRRL